LASSGIYYVYQYDPMGNYFQRADAAQYGVSGEAYAVIDTAQYDAYGNMLADIDANDGEPATSREESIGFGGQNGYFTDSDTAAGLVCLGHRYYDPSTGRFINRDPIGYAGGENLYAFCGGNPVNCKDPTGKDITIGPGSDPWFVFSASDTKQGLATGWDGFSTAVWQTPGLSNVNAKYGCYQPTYTSEPGYKASVAFGRLGVDATLAAVGLKVVGATPALNTWWNIGILTNVPIKDLLYNEIGNNTLNSVKFATYSVVENPVARGKFMVARMGWLESLFGGGSAGFVKPGAGGTLSFGPTQGARALMRGAGLAGFLAIDYFSNKSTYDAGIEDIYSSMK
jgi:RHS repeat-associated protein